MSGERMKLVAFKAIRKGSLRGFAAVVFPFGIMLPDVPVHVGSNGKAWAAIPGKPRLGRDGELMRNAVGKIEYSPIFSFTSDKLRDAFSQRVCQLIAEYHPEALE